MSINAEQLDQEADNMIARQFDDVDTPEHEESATDNDEQTTHQETTETKQPDAASDNVVSIERYKNAEARMHQALQEAAALRKEVDELRHSVEARQDESGTEKKQHDDLDSLMEDYPEIVGPLVGKLKAMERLLADVQKSTDTIQQQAAKTQQEQHLAAIQSVHPDVVEIANSPDFQGWVARQTDVIKNAVAHGSADDVIYILDRYKTAMGMQKSSKLEQARNVATPNVGGAKPNTQGQPRYTRESIAAMSTEEFAKHEKAIDEAMAKGLVA